HRERKCDDLQRAAHVPIPSGTVPTEDGGVNPTIVLPLPASACAPLADGALRLAPGAAHLTQGAVAARARMSGCDRLAAVLHEPALLQRIAKGAELRLGDLVVFEQQLQPCHLEEHPGLAAGRAGQHDEFVGRCDYLLKLSVPVLFLHYP